MVTLCFGEKEHSSKAPFSFCHLKNVYCLLTWLITVGVNIDHLAQVVSERLLHCNIILFIPFLILYSLEGVTMCSLHLRSENYVPPSWGWSIYINYLEFFYMNSFVFMVYFWRKVPKFVFQFLYWVFHFWHHIFNFLYLLFVFWMLLFRITCSYFMNEIFSLMSSEVFALQLFSSSGFHLFWCLSLIF